MPDVFLSYSHEDLAVAQRFARGFERAGLTVWWDQTLRSGDPYDKVTEQALRQARAVVVLWSPRSVEARWVRAEATIADRLGTLVPVMIAPCERPVMFELTQAADLTHWTGNYGDRVWRQCLADVRARVERSGNGSDSAPGVAEPASTYAHGVAVRSAPAVSRRVLYAGAAALLLAGVATWAYRHAGGFASSGQSTNSVAVLPFANLGGDPAQNYLSDGLAAEIRAELARDESLQIVAQTSSGMFRDNRTDAKEIARKLDAAYLLEGNLWRSGDSLRVSAELIDGRTGFSRWSRTFDGSLSNLLQVQSEIARAVAEALAAQFGRSLPAGQGVSDRLGSTNSVAAFEAYLRGRELFAQASGEAVDRAAIEAFDQALALDGNFGAAHAARSRALTAVGNQYVQGGERLALYEDAVASANMAIRVAPDLADAWSALGFALFSGRVDVRAAREPYERSRLLGGGDADVLNRYALFSARTGNFVQAREAMARALSLDPLNARMYRSAGAVEYAARRYAESIPPIERSLQMNPELNGGWAALGTSQLMLGRVAQAKESFETERSNLFGPVGIAIIAHREGRLREAQQALSGMIENNGDNSWYQQAQVYAQWGDRDRAIEALRQGRAARDAGLGLLLNDPLLDPVRKDPEFGQLLRELGFTD